MTTLATNLICVNAIHYTYCRYGQSNNVSAVTQTTAITTIPRSQKTANNEFVQPNKLILQLILKTFL